MRLRTALLKEPEVMTNPAIVCGLAQFSSANRRPPIMVGLITD